MFTDRIALLIASKARAASLNETSMLAIVQVETAGNFFEPGTRVPTMRFEHAIFYRQLKQHAPSKLPAAIRQGLAFPNMNVGKTSAAQRTPQMRAALIAAARAIDEEIANASTSWGAGQIMGFNHAACGFPTANSMVAAMTKGGEDAQIDMMIGLLKTWGLTQAINEWRPVQIAQKWNGAAYAVNHYDTNLANAKKIWERKLPQLKPSGGEIGGAPATPARVTPPEQALSIDEVKAIQVRLRLLGYTEVGEPGGGWDTKCTGAISAFQAHEGLPVTGHYDAETARILNDDATLPRASSQVRQDQTIDDLRQKGSRTIKNADRMSLWGKIKLGLGLGSLGGGSLTSSGAIDKVQELADKGSTVQSLAERFKGLFDRVFTPEGLLVVLLLVGGGAAVLFFSGRIKIVRLEDHQSGVHVGPAQEVEDA